MNKLIQTIEMLRQKLPALRRHSLNETSTRTIVIDQLLEKLGWDIRDPDEVQLEYPTIDSKSVDYAIKMNKKPILLVEAKAMDDALDDVKAVTQVVGYAANNGIVWCILTNGIKWRISEHGEMFRTGQTIVRGQYRSRRFRGNDGRSNRSAPLAFFQRGDGEGHSGCSRRADFHRRQGS